MAISVEVHQKLNEFMLEVEFASDSKRIGILGASGCGKSMTLRSIAGVHKIDQGKIVLNDRILCDSRQEINLKPQQRRIGYMFQNYALFPTMTVEQNIMAGLHGKREDNKIRAREMIDRFQLKGLENRVPGQLSGGQQQRTALARIMAYEPDMILLDEPFSAMDGFLSDKLQQEMFKMLEDYEGTVILVSHNRDEIYRFCDELLIMQDGKLLCQGKTKEVFEDPKYVAAARLTGCKNLAGIECIDDQSFLVPDWDCTLHFPAKQAKSIGYRAHEFRPIWGEEKENCIPFRLKSIAELPFERKYYLYGQNDFEICWYVQKNQWIELDEKGLPDYLQICMEHVLYLLD